MATFVLIAGAWHGSWCWSEVAPLLQAADHRVIAPDLLGMRNGGASEIREPLGVWADQIADVLKAELHPVILVGHSRAGLVISEVAERVPEKISCLVYLCAFMLQDGQTLQEVAREAENAAEFASATLMHDDGTASIDKVAMRRLFYNETPEPLVEAAKEQLVPEPLSSFVTPVHVTGRRFGTVDRAYVACLRDNAIPISTQRAMQAALPCARSLELDSDHSPFFSMPKVLADALLRLAG